MLPYFEQPTLHLGPVPLYAFGLLVGIGVLTGVELAHRRAERFGVDGEKLRWFVFWILVPGFLLSHLFDALWYHPRQVLSDPGMLLQIGGLSSYGGFLGATLGAIAWRLRHREPVLPYVDLTLSVFPIAWTFGRMGCTVAHDHPGVHTSPNNPLAFAYPDGPRWDLGFLEMLFSLALSIVVVAMWKKDRPIGTYVALTALTYAPVRFALDFLREVPANGGDERYWGVTPAQVACGFLIAIGLWAWREARESRGITLRAETHASAPNEA
jgi:phosphatidylglycerol:prolipoprotein diacylglycerol transferase